MIHTSPHPGPASLDQVGFYSTIWHTTTAPLVPAADKAARTMGEGVTPCFKCEWPGTLKYV